MYTELNKRIPSAGQFQAVNVPGVWGSQISTEPAQVDGKIVSPTHRPPLPPTKFSFFLEAESTQSP